jgi:hypothetical protein
MNIDLFNINTVGRSENILILKGERFNGSKFTIYINRSIDINKTDYLQTYIYTSGTYYIISIDNFNMENNLDYKNFIWEHVPPELKDFPFYIYGIHPSAYFYIKGLILT